MVSLAVRKSHARRTIQTTASGVDFSFGIRLSQCSLSPVNGSFGLRPLNFSCIQAEIDARPTADGVLEMLKQVKVDKIANALVIYVACHARVSDVDSQVELLLQQPSQFEKTVVRESGNWQFYTSAAATNLACPYLAVCLWGGGADPILLTLPPTLFPTTQRAFR